MNLREALTGEFTPGDLESYFHLPIRDRPCCWSSLLGLYTPFTVAGGITFDLWHPGHLVAVYGRLPSMMRSFVNYLGIPSRVPLLERLTPEVHPAMTHIDASPDQS